MHAIDHDAVFHGLLFCEHEMVARREQCFARDAAYVQTRAAKLFFSFDKRCLQSELTGADRSDVTARSRANNYNVKFFHDYSSARRMIASRLKIERQLLRILDALFHLDEERDSFFSID